MILGRAGEVVGRGGGGRVGESWTKGMRDHRGSDLGRCGKTKVKYSSGRLNQVSKVRVFVGSRKVRARRSLV